MDYIIYFAIAIGILVFVHEFGHFAAAKLLGMRADVFAIGFGKRLFGYNKINGLTFGNLPKDFDTQGNTDYRLCLLPLGGYVKIAGMVDESFDTKFADKEPEPYEFRAQPTWKKVIVITAGVFMNLILALVVFWGINFSQGKTVVETTTIGYVSENSVADSLGFQTNDKIISINNAKVSTWEEVTNNLLLNNLGNDISIKLERNGIITDLKIPSSKMPNPTEESSAEFLWPKGLTAEVKRVLSNSPAEEAGFKAGDVFLKIGNNSVYTTNQVIENISQNKNKNLPVLVSRNDEELTLNVTPSGEGKIGVEIGRNYNVPIKNVSYGFFESFSQGWKNIVYITDLTFSTLAKVIGGKVEFGSAFGGPVKIAKQAADSAENGLINFLFFIGVLSLSLAIINILPFPVLDGGHLVIILIEGVIKREVPMKIKMAIQQVGFAILLLLMAFIIYNDIISL